MKNFIFLGLLIFLTKLTGQVTYEQINDPEQKIRGKYESYTASDGKIYNVGDLLRLKYAAANGLYSTVMTTGMIPTYKPESPNEVVEIENFKAIHTFGISGMYALVRGADNKKYQIVIDLALQANEIAEYNKGVSVESKYDEMEETTSFHTSTLTIADGVMPYLDFSIAKVSNSKYYLRVYYNSKYNLSGCFRKDDNIKIKTDKHGIIELLNVMNTECGKSGVLAYEVPENLLIQLSESNWELMRLYNSEPYLEYKPDGNSDYFAKLATAILEY